MLHRSITPEQINKRDGGVFRSAEVSRVIDEESRTVELAFSSEAEVERWFGVEVLSHAGGAMRTERLENGAAVLWNHDWDDQVGVVESIEIGADRRGRAVVRFGKSARASDIFQDILDGIIRHVSVGYRVYRVEVEERSGQPDLVTVTDWEPYEISLVSVPADPTVGVGRSLEDTPAEARTYSTQTDPQTSNHQGTIMQEKILRDAQGNLVRAKVDDDDKILEVLEIIEKAGDEIRQAERRASSAERSRVHDIMAMGEQYGARDLAQDFARDGKTPAEFQRALLDHLNTDQGRALNDQASSDVGMSDDEVRQFSFIRALRALSNPTDRRAQEAAAFEYEASRAAAERSGKEPEGILVPADVLKRALNSSNSGAAAGDTGGYSISTDLMSQSFVEMLRNRAIAMQLGTPLGGLVGNLDIPGQSGGASGYWIGEDEDAREDGLELDQIGMTPKTVAALAEITRKLLMQSSLDVEALVRRDLASALALTVDKAVFYGTGTDKQPLGIANVTGINAVPFAKGLPSYTETVQMESAIAADNADVNSMAYVMASGMRGHYKTTQKFDGTNGSPIWEQGNTVNGYRSEVTNQIKSGDLFFGNFADLLIGMWGGLDLTVDPYTHSAKGRVRVVAMQDIDVVLRRIESFCLGRSANQENQS